MFRRPRPDPDYIARLERDLLDLPPRSRMEDMEADRARRNMERLIERRGRRGGLQRREIDALLRAFVNDDP